MGKKHSKRQRNSSNSELTDDDLEYLVQRTHFKRKEILDWHSGFMKDCPNGVINKRKFIDVYRQFYPNGRAEKFCGFLFNAFDANKSGEIDFFEFLCAISITKGDIREKLSLTFKMYDIDGNGSIDLKELTKIIKAIYDFTELDDTKNNGTPTQKANQIMKKFDKNGDKLITEREFIDGCLEDEELQDLLSPFHF